MEKQLHFSDKLATQEHIETCVEARDIAEENKDVRLNKMLDYFRKVGDIGATCDEVEIYFKWLHQSVSSMIRYLTKKKYLKRTEKKRINSHNRKAYVWVIVKDSNVEPETFKFKVSWKEGHSIIKAESEFDAICKLKRNILSILDLNIEKELK